jgi:hypothetical protein
VTRLNFSFDKNLPKTVISLPQLSYFDLGLVLVAHAYNPRYSGGRNQEHGSSKPA